MPRFDYDNSGRSIASVTVITHAERAGNHYILSNNQSTFEGFPVVVEVTGKVRALPA